MSDVLVGRQPIYRKDLSVFGYELLFRHGQTNQANVLNGEQATARVIINAFMEIGLERIVGEQLAFINITRNFIVSKYCHALPTNRVVLEVLEDVAADPQVLEALSELVAHGYTIALDDFVYREELKPLLKFADIIKLDVLALGQSGLEEQLTQLRPFEVKFVAEKVDSYEDFDFCRRLGFDFFQGYFFCRPRILSGKATPINRMSIVVLLSKLLRPDIALEELETHISADVTLSYKLLRYLNSAACGLVRRVGSIRDAVIFVGMERVRTWASMILLAGVESKPLELMVTAIQRAKMSELLAAAIDNSAGNRERFFVAGLFSVLDALLDCPMEEVLLHLPLSVEISDALVRHEGMIWAVLRCVLNYEQGNWDNLKCQNLSTEVIKDCYLESLAWSSKVAGELAAIR